MLKSFSGEVREPGEYLPRLASDLIEGIVPG
jgi:hypothetical protein